jgi:hypothetical protein
MPIFDPRLWSAHDVTKVERETALAQNEKAEKARKTARS